VQLLRYKPQYTVPGLILVGSAGLLVLVEITGRVLLAAQIVAR